MKQTLMGLLTKAGAGVSVATALCPLGMWSAIALAASSETGNLMARTWRSCERASAYLVSKGLTDVNQLKGGIHRYLEEYEEDGGYWVGSNYTFDKRFSHGAKNKQVISKCVVCDEPWERYAAHKKCTWCKMEVLVCRTCDRKAKAKPPNRVPIPKGKLVCPLCRDPQLKKVNQHGVQG